MNLAGAFEILSQYCALLPDTATNGLGGIWTAESKKGDEIAYLRVYDGGYNQIVVSQKYAVTLSQSITNQHGTRYELKGTEENLSACVQHCADVLNLPSAKLSVVPKIKVK